jgi:flagellar protein FlaG
MEANINYAGSYNASQTTNRVGYTARQPQPQRREPARTEVPSANTAAEVPFVNTATEANAAPTEDFVTQYIRDYEPPAMSLPRALSGSEISETTISRVIYEANQALSPTNFRLTYNIHESTNNVMVTVIDRDTNEVLREIPPESRLDIVARMLEFAGILFDEAT